MFSYTMFVPLRTPVLAIPLIAAVAVWHPLFAHQPHDPINVVALSPNYVQDQTLFVATSAITMPLPVGEYVTLMSTNGGLSFTVLPGIPNQLTRSIAISPSYTIDGTVFMGGAGGLWKSSTRGSSWTAVADPRLATGVESVALASDFATSGVSFALTARKMYRSTTHGSTWQALAGPAGLNSSFTVAAISPNYSQDKTVLAGTVSSGLFVSTNAGVSWTQVSLGSTAAKISAVAFSPAYATDHTLFAVTYGGGVYVSLNSGVNWLSANAGVTDLNATAVALSPDFTVDGTLWIACASGVFVSRDRGNSWAMTSAPPRPFSPQTSTHFVSLSSSKTSTGVALFAGMFEGLWNSSDLGNSWSYSDTIPTRLVRSLAVSPTYPQDHTVFASTYGGGTLWSFDGGQTWSFRNTGLPDSYTDATAMAPDFSTSKTAFIGTTSGLERITGGSSVWQMMQDLGKPTFPRSLGLSPNFVQDSTVFIGTHSGPGYPKYVVYQGKQYPNRGLFTSVNAGQNWEPTGIQGDAVDSIAVSPDFPEDGTIFAGSSVSGLLKSSDGGVTFSSIPVVLNDSGILPVVCSPAYATDHTVFTGTSHSGLFKSVDSGNTWAQLPGSSQLTAFAFALSPNYANDQTLFVGTLQQGLMKSVDGGNSLTPIPSVPGYFASGVVISPGYAVDQTVFVSTYLGIYKSMDGGTTWAYTAEPARQEEQREIGAGAFTSIVYQGAWSVAADTAASTSQYIKSNQSGDTASLTFWGSGAAWIGVTSPSGGSAQVVLDGLVDGTVSLQSPATNEQQTLWVRHGLPCGAHTITIKASSLAAGQSINLDALDVWQDTCTSLVPNRRPNF